MVFGENRDTESCHVSDNKKTLLTCVVVTVAVPAVLKKMTSAISNAGLSHAVVERCLICLKEEWMK